MQSACLRGFGTFLIYGKGLLLDIRIDGSLGIAPTLDCTHFLKIGFVIAGGGLYSYHIHQGNKSDRGRKIVRKKLSFTHTKILKTFFKGWVQFRVDAIPRLPV